MLHLALEKDQHFPSYGLKTNSMRRVINILLVEDDRLDQTEVQRTLVRKNIVHKLNIAKNGEEALQFLATHTVSERPDIILMDLNMPKMNGFELLENIRERNPLNDVKIFVLTTSEEREDKIKAARLGVSGFITKPLKLESPSSIDAFNLMIDLMNMQAK
jgi:CheY-like chemotaxis protein